MAERDPIDLIKEQINRAEELVGVHAEHELFTHWQGETKTILEKAFSSRSIHYQNFVALRFQQMTGTSFVSPEIDKLNATRYRRDLESAKNILHAAIKELTLDRTLFKKMQTTPKTVEILLTGEYFVSSGISDPGMIQAIEATFEGGGLKPTSNPETRGKGVSLPDRIEQIKRARFGIYDVSGPERADVFLELGAAFGLGREAIILTKKNSPFPAVARQFDRVEYENFSDLSEKLRKKIRP